MRRNPRPLRETIQRMKSSATRPKDFVLQIRSRTQFIRYPVHSSRGGGTKSSSPRLRPVSMPETKTPDRRGLGPTLIAPMVASDKSLMSDGLMSTYATNLPSSRSLSSLRALRRSRLSCLSISRFMRRCSRDSSLRQHSQIPVIFSASLTTVRGDTGKKE